MWTVWITVLVAFNRYVAICMPFQAIRVCTMRQARLQVLASAIAIIVYNVPRFLEHRLDFNYEVVMLRYHFFDTIYTKYRYTDIDIDILSVCNLRIRATGKTQNSPRQRKNPENSRLKCLLLHALTQ